MGFRVIDNFLTKPRLNLVRYEFRKLKENIPLKWFSEPYPGMKVKHTKKVILKEAVKHYNFKKYIGFEEWSQNNTQCNSHVDKDEGYFKRTNGRLKLPICSIVFYVEVENLEGGRLMLGEDIITPKTNRLVMFDPGIHHHVEPFNGTRRTYLINPWNSMPENYLS